MDMTTTPAADQDLLDLIAESVEYAASILDQQDVLEPFTIIEYDDEKHTMHYAFDPDFGEGLDEVLAKARDAITIGATEISAYAIVSATELTLEASKQSVILIEAGTRGSEDGVLLAQPYQPPQGLFGFELSGNLLLLGRPTNLLF